VTQVRAFALITGAATPTVRYMTKEEILQELPKLVPKDRDDLLFRLHELSEQDLISGAVSPSSIPLSEKVLLDAEWEEYQHQPHAGEPWSDVYSRLKSRK
jgi:hypothetical protein